MVGDEESCWGGDEVYDVEGGGMFSGGHVMTWVDNLVKAEVLVDKRGEGSNSSIQSHGQRRAWGLEAGRIKVTGAG